MTGVQEEPSDQDASRAPSRVAAGVYEERKPSLRRCWLVFARRRYDESLSQVGTVTADDPDMAVIFAQSIYDEHPWIEMVVVPRNEMRTVIAS